MPEPVETTEQVVYRGADLAHFQVNLSFARETHGERDLWVASCPSLDLHATGETREAAKGTLHAMVKVLLTDLGRTNRSARVLPGYGWSMDPPAHALRSEESTEFLRPVHAA